MRDTIVVNLFGGPGTGKSTKAFLLAGELKARGASAELVHEYAKDLTWEERTTALKFQPYVAAKQQYHIYRVMGKVDIIITDSPILLSCIYKGDGYTTHLANHLISTYKSWDTLSVFLKRDPAIHPYQKTGRNQTEEEATKIDNKILRFLRYHRIPYHTVKMSKDHSTIDNILCLIENHKEI